MPRDFSKEMVQLEGAGAGLFSLAQVSDQVATASLRQSRLGLRPIPVLHNRGGRGVVRWLQSWFRSPSGHVLVSASAEALSATAKLLQPWSD